MDRYFYLNTVFYQIRIYKILKFVLHKIRLSKSYFVHTIFMVPNSVTIKFTHKALQGRFILSFKLLGNSFHNLAPVNAKLFL